MTDTLYELGQEYLLESRKINARITQLKACIKDAPLDELRGLEERISILYEEHAELRKNGFHLIHYYGRGDLYEEKLLG